MGHSNIKFRWYLFPFSFLYGLFTSIRNRLYDYNLKKSHEFSIPVIVVGNITVGGTGKTPHVEYLIKMLKDQFEVVSLSRGYKRKTKGFLIASEKSTVQDIGDEPKQIKKKFPDIDVIVDGNRVRAINKLLDDENKKDLNAIILDDAFQHRKVKPGLSILLIDYNRPISKDYLLPVGNLRERSWRKKRANLIIVSKTPNDIKPIDRRIMEKELNIFPYQSLFFTGLKNGDPIPLFDKNLSEPMLNKASIVLITGIATPDPLLNYLKTFTDSIDHIKYPDHYNFKQQDMNTIIDRFNQVESENKLILTTEKDAMRLHDCQFAEKIANLPIFYIPVEIEFQDKENEKYFKKIIIDYVRKNKRHNQLHI